MSPNLPERFEAMVARHPERVALSDEDSLLSYAQLGHQVNQLAHHLIASGIGPGDRVALWLPRSVDLVVAILGVLGSGAAYVPLDPDHPAGRVASTIADAAPVLVLTTSRAGSRVPTGTDVFVIDDPVSQAALAAHPTTAPTNATRRRRLDPADAAYVIYTSGSTGVPKGVSISHRNVGALLDAALPLFDVGVDDTWTLFHSYAFDFSVWELWGPLSTGGRLLVVPKAVTWSPTDFAQLLASEGVTVLSQTPSAFFALVAAEEERLAAGGRPLELATVVFGGEALDVSRLAAWWRLYPPETARLVNMYGITETTVHVTWLTVDPALAAGGGSPIGVGLPGLRVHLLDDKLQPVAEGQLGEIYVGGDQVAGGGYVDRAGLTATRFVADPRGGGERLYRTGDLARRRDGALHFAGRADAQVKIRGFRVELGEIEAALADLAPVAQCAVVPYDHPELGRQLVAYVVPRAGQTETFDPVTIRAELATRLPAHFLPAVYVTVDALPLTVNGKLDRASLPPPPTAPGPGRPSAERRRELLRRRLAAPETPPEPVMNEVAP